MTEVQALGQLASTGVVGVFLVLALFALRSVYRELSEERDARIKDSQDTLQMILKIQQGVTDAVHKLGQIVEAWETRADAEREERRHQDRNR
jgi:uncharacterized membrane protein YccC